MENIDNQFIRKILNKMTKNLATKKRGFKLASETS